MKTNIIIRHGASIRVGHLSNMIEMIAAIRAEPEIIPNARGRRAQIANMK